MQAKIKNIYRSGHRKKGGGGGERDEKEGWKREVSMWGEKGVGHLETGRALVGAPSMQLKGSSSLITLPSAYGKGRQSGKESY